MRGWIPQLGLTQSGHPANRSDSPAPSQVVGPTRQALASVIPCAD